MDIGVIVESWLLDFTFFNLRNGAPLDCVSSLEIELYKRLFVKLENASLILRLKISNSSVPSSNLRVGQ